MSIQCCKFTEISNKSNCPSLNDCLISGPNLIPDLLTLLLQFRLRRVNLSADVGAFLQIALDSV